MGDHEWQWKESLARKKQLVETDVPEEHSKDKFAVIYFHQNILKMLL